ncbi:MAG: hypothetical protein M0C28_27880 [Candidatus Moduliflexus flocculans]|nr:hypothetical protein [Candidatus Moduliflexus flocculans]
MSIPTDCPQRDERHGWLGDAHLAAEEAVYNFDMAAFYVKFLDDIRLAQKEDGSLPDVVPPYLPRFYPADPAWSVGLCRAPCSPLGPHGRPAPRRRPLRRPQEVRRIPRPQAPTAASSASSASTATGVPPGSVVPKKTPGRPDLDLVLLPRRPRPGPPGRPPRPRAPRPVSTHRLADSVRTAFNDTFLGESQYAAIRVSPVDDHPNQTSNLLPLYLDMVPGDRKEKVAGEPAAERRASSRTTTSTRASWARATCSTS